MTKVTIFNITWKRVIIELHLRDIAGNYKISRYQTRHQSTFQEKKNITTKVVTSIVTWKRTFIPLEVRTSVEGEARDLVEKEAEGDAIAHGGRNRKRDGISGNPARVYLCPRVCSPFYSPEMQRKKWGGMQETTWKNLATLFKLGQFSD